MKTKRAAAYFTLAGFLTGILLTLLAGLLISDGKTPFPPLSSSRGSLSPGASANGGAVPELVVSAYAVAGLIYKGDFSALSEHVHPDGVLFTPFSTVQKDRDLMFTASEIKSFSTREEALLWGVYPLSGEPINLTPRDFFKELLQTQDFASAPVLGINRVAKSGNASENVAEQFPNDSFVDFYYPPSGDSPEWSSLKLVFRGDSSGKLKLVAIIKSVYSEQ